MHHNRRGGPHWGHNWGHRGAPQPWHRNPHDPDTPPWTREDWYGRRRFFLVRFLGVVFLMMLLVAGGMAMFAFHLTRFFGGDGQMTRLVWMAGCGLALAFPLVAFIVATRIFRNYAIPLADMMTAADAVAGGDLSVRVSELGSREFRQLVSSFNRMIAELERTDQQRRNLTADVAHELRTPLHIIQGNLEGVLDGVYQPTNTHIEATLEETRLLARLVEDLRTLSLAESGQLPLVCQLVNLDDLLADVVTSFSGQAELAGIDLHLEAASRQPGAVLAQAGLFANVDAGRLDQVISNLVANALRYTPRGGMVALAAKADTAANKVLITVTDTGEGIAAEDLPFLFDRFWRADRARAHTSGVGSGLGLAIASQLVKAHNGTITVKSELGKGSCFTVELPSTN